MRCIFAAVIAVLSLFPSQAPAASTRDARPKVEGGSAAREKQAKPDISRGQSAEGKKCQWNLDRKEKMERMEL